MDRMQKSAAMEQLGRDLSQPGGFSTVAQTMLEPFKEGRDYVSIGRKVVAVHHLEPGAPAWYDIDPQFTASTISSQGGAPKALDGKLYDRVELTHFPICQAIRIGVEQPSIRRFDVLDREQTRAQAEMAKQEDVELFTVLYNAAGVGSGISDGVTPPASIAAAAFSFDLLSQGFANIEDVADSNVENVLMRATSYQKIRALLHSNPNTFDPVTRRELIKTGYIGDIWNAQVRQSKRLTAAKILCLASPEYLGVLSVRIDLSHMDAPDPMLLQYGAIFYEFIQPAVLTNVGVCQISHT